MGRGYKWVGWNKILCIYKRITILQSKKHEQEKENKINEHVFNRIVIMKRDFYCVRRDS
jgi:hypothetical protein